MNMENDITETIVLFCKKHRISKHETVNLLYDVIDDFHSSDDKSINEILQIAKRRVDVIGKG